jgi:hypothetical protein
LVLETLKGETMSESSSSSSGGIGFVGLLTIVFITLKLTEVIDWSWWWVLSPLWISVAVVVGITVLVLLVLGFVALFALCVDKWHDRKVSP